MKQIVGQQPEFSFSAVFLICRSIADRPSAAVHDRVWYGFKDNAIAALSLLMDARPPPPRLCLFGQDGAAAGLVFPPTEK